MNISIMLKKICITLQLVMIPGVLLLASACSPEASIAPSTVTPSESVTDVEVTPLAGSPWPDVVSYADATAMEKMATGDEFTIGLNVTPRLGERWIVEYQDTFLSLQESQTVMADPNSPVTGTTWFRFKAISHGSVQITFSLISATNVVRDEISFRFQISG